MPDEEGNIESVIEESLKATPLFSDRNFLQDEKTLADRLVPVLVATSATFLSIPGTQLYVPIAVGAATFVLAKQAWAFRQHNLRVRQQGGITAGHAEAPEMFNRLFSAKPYISLIGAALGFSAGTIASGKVKAYGWEAYADAAKNIQSLTPEIAYSLATGLGTYVIFGGLERALHPETVKTARSLLSHNAQRKLHNYSQAAASLEAIAQIPHSKEKEAALMLLLGDARLSARRPTEALLAYKAMLTAASREDGLAGISDWVIQAKPEGFSELLGEPNDLEQMCTEIGKAMHMVAERNYSAADAALARSIRKNPGNRHLHRMRALLMEATGNHEIATAAMKAYQGILLRDPTVSFRILGESRNEVLVPIDEAEPMPDLYIKRSDSKNSIDEEVKNLEAFSRELPGKIPKVLRTGFDGTKHYVVLESLGHTTLHQRAIAGKLSFSDAKATIDLLLAVIAAGEKLGRLGKINIRESANEPRYTYTMSGNAAAKPFLGNDDAMPNIQDGINFYFGHRILDLFALRVMASNGVHFDDEYFYQLGRGAVALSLTLDPTIFSTYSDFTRKNIICGEYAGNVKGKADFENIRRLPAFFELVNILEFYSPTFADVPHEFFFNYFRRRFDALKGVAVNPDIRRTQYEACAVLRNLELVGYRSRDTATNPDNLRAQVYHHLMARNHLESVARKAPERLRLPMREMLKTLNTRPIMPDASLQRELEHEIKRLMMPTFGFAR